MKRESKMSKKETQEEKEARIITFWERINTSKFTDTLNIDFWRIILVITLWVFIAILISFVYLNIAIYLTRGL